MTGTQAEKATGGNSTRVRTRNKRQGSNIISRFFGLNQDQLKGIVISESHATPPSQQYDALYEALMVYGGNKNPQVVGIPRIEHEHSCRYTRVTLTPCDGVTRSVTLA